MTEASFTARDNRHCELPVPGEHLNPRSGAYPMSPMALEDAQRTIGLVRYHAAEWHIDPHKIGVLGFSAGGHLVGATSTNFGRFYCAIRPGWIPSPNTKLAPTAPTTAECRGRSSFWRIR